MANDPNGSNSPIDLSAGLAPTPTAPQNPAPINLSAGLVPASPEPKTETPPPVDLSAGVSKPISPADHGILSGLKEAADKVEIGIGHLIPESATKPLAAVSKILTGPGTLFGPETTGPSWSDLFNEPFSQTLQKMKAAGHAAINSSLIIPANAQTPEYQAAHPDAAAAVQGVSNAVKGVTTPGNLALIVATDGISRIPGLVETAFKAIPTAAPYAGKAVLAAKATLTGLGAYFTEEQLRLAVKAVPEVAEAIAAGDTPKAIELTTAALINAGFGVYGGIQTGRGIRGFHGVRPIENVSGDVKALQNKDYADAVHERIKDLQVAEAQKQLLADMAQKAIPSLADREWTTEYIEANQDRAELARRQAETKAGPKPSDAIAAAQGEQLSLEDGVVPNAENGNGQGGHAGNGVASAEELNRPGRFVKISRSGQLTDMGKSPDFGELKPGEAGYQVKPDGSFELKAGQETPTTKLGVESYAKEVFGKTEVAPPVKTKPSPTKSILPSEEAGQEALSLQKALDDAKQAAARRVPTPEERARMITQQDPNRRVTPEQQKYIDFRNQLMERTRDQLQELNLLPKHANRENFVMHDYGFDDESNSVMQRLHDTYHEAQQAGLVVPNKDIGALDSDYIQRIGKRIANTKTINALKSGRMNSGTPLYAPGGFIEGQRVSAEGPQTYEVSSQDLASLKRRGNLPDLIRSGRIQSNPDGSFRWNVSDYKPTNLVETRPIGPAPIPPNVLEEMTSNGSLDALEKKGLVYKNDKGEYFNKENLYARVPVYVHPDIADHFNGAVVPTYDEPTSAFGRIGKFYDDVTGNMKSLLLSWSPFHRVTEGLRLMESLGIPQGLKTSFTAEPIDYFNLTPSQEAALRDGIIVANPLGISRSNVSEGLSAGNSNSWGGKTYKLFNKGLEKLGVPENIRNAIDPQKILTDNVFGPTGLITRAKFALYNKLKPEIAAIMQHDNPSWEPWKIDIEAGREAAKFANNKFGGFNNVLAGRTLQDQKWLRRILLAPDFLETTGRSILDLTSPYGAPLVKKLIEFNLAWAMSIGAINYALHHNEEDHSIIGAVKASHMLDHPFAVVSPDGKTTYNVRTTTNDFLHLMNDPRNFVYNRLNPMLKATAENVEQRNQYGRRVTPIEAAEAFPKAALPINLQPFVGLGPGSVTEPTKTDMILKSLGATGMPDRSDAENAAIHLVEQKIEGSPALTGSALVRQQLKFKAEDRLRDAYAIKDPDKKHIAIDVAKNDINALVAQKMIDPEDRKRIMVAAQGSRLKSIFTSLTPTDALHVWDLGTPQEKKDLEVPMHAKYVRWLEGLGKRGLNVTNLGPEDRMIFNHFRQAAVEAEEVNDELRRKEIPPPSQPIDLSAGLRPEAQP